MPHDKVKAAARQRMAETGENYTTARREVMEGLAWLRAHQAETVSPDANEIPGE